MSVLSAAPLVIIAQAVTSTAPQVVYVPPPVPPLSAVRGSPYYAQARTQHEDALRRQCYSEEGIKLILEQDEKSAAPNPVLSAQELAIMAEVSAAATAEPLDLRRLGAARAKFRAFWLSASAKVMADQDRRRFDLLRRLPAPDRNRFVRDSLALGGELPGHREVCSVNGQAPPPPIAPPPLRIAPAPKK